ncbi:MAG: pyruvate dehydrogenase [Chloroflexaceae bacterium]|nr:pyruvate dehydrogenase [Chloroflexaceae bacterium]
MTLTALPHTYPPTLEPEHLATLDTIQRRVLWLATMMVHHANNVRPNPDGTKVGGHQASSASLVTILTALYFHFLQAGDRVSIKPHASPAFHAVQYLLGQLPQHYLPTLREFKGLQAYPSRTKDPVRVDFSTGSVGFGAVAPAFGALAHRYARSHFDSITSRRFIALIGDAELDEGNIWEAILDDALAGLENLIWIVDLNRQSLDRVIPGIKAARLKALFEEHDWQVLEAKYGRKLQALYARPGGAALRKRIDDMNNEEYQALIRLPGDQLRKRIIHIDGIDSVEIAQVIKNVPDADLPGVIGNLGGHDLEELLAVLDQTNTTQPTVIFAYTIKGWGLPTAGHPLNHSQLLTQQQIDALREVMGIAPDAIWDAFAPDSAAGRLCAEAAARLFGTAPLPPQTVSAAVVPTTLGLPARGSSSTQDAFGRVLVRLADVEGLRERIVTAAPDVATSTNLAGWINKVGVYEAEEQPLYETEAMKLLKWHRSPAGQHIELGISEMNLFTFLGMFGIAHDLCGQQLIPIGTVYDPFVCRGLDALIYSLYSGGRFIFAGTPSGVTLSPEGGAHQSIITPSIGAELPYLRFYEPCFSREVEWIMLEALRQCCDLEHGWSTYLRLSTAPIEQGLLEPALQRIGEDTLREHVLAGGYRLIDWRDSQTEPPTHLVQIATSGAMMPEAVAAAQFLQQEGVAANVLNLTSPRSLFERWRTSQQARLRGERGDALDWLIPPAERHAPIITVLDGAPQALAWLGSAFSTRVVALGVDSFGQSGRRADLYRTFGIDRDTMIEAAFAAVDGEI